jgi:hypothetical protein
MSDSKIERNMKYVNLGKSGLKVSQVCWSPNARPKANPNTGHSRRHELWFVGLAAMGSQRSRVAPITQARL